MSVLACWFEVAADNSDGGILEKTGNVRLVIGKESGLDYGLGSLSDRDEIRSQESG